MGAMDSSKPPDYCVTVFEEHPQGVLDFGPFGLALDRHASILHAINRCGQRAV
jgi:hypothetical protein